MSNPQQRATADIELPKYKRFIENSNAKYNHKWKALSWMLQHVIFISDFEYEYKDEDEKHSYKYNNENVCPLIRNNVNRIIWNELRTDVGKFEQALSEN